MYFSDDSIVYEATDSGDDRIEKYVKQRKADEYARKASEEEVRSRAFDDIFAEQTSDIFRLAGVKFSKFTHRKIKFSFTPSEIRNFVSKTVIFYCSLKYLEKYDAWTIRRDSFPANYKWKIYRLFYSGDYFRVVDELLIDTLVRIYTQLVHWANEEEYFRLDKFKRYQRGEDVFLDADDEELFLTEEEVKEQHERRERVLKRMLPPVSMSRKKRRL